jgi:ketosteroid isomerase-like protein
MPMAAIGSMPRDDDIAKTKGNVPVTDAEKLKVNKAVVRKYLESVAAFDLQAIGECLADNVIQHYVAPSYLVDDGNHGAQSISSRESILNEIGSCFHDILYRKGTVTIEIQAIIAEGDYVDCRFILDAMTVRSNEHYRNYYNFFYRCEDGKVVEYWEYLDTKYAGKMFWDD